MKILINKSHIKGSARAPSSKSYTIRALMSAALAKGRSEISSPLSSDDTEAAINVLKKVGIQIDLESDRWKVTGGNFKIPEEDYICDNSAATLRFMSAICALVPGYCRLTAGTSLSKRPVRTLVEALKKWRIEIDCKGDYAPVTVKGGSFRGGLTDLPGDISSQYITALLLIAPLAAEKSKIVLNTPLESQPYVLMTLECINKFGIKIDYSDDLRLYEANPQAYKPIVYHVEGDWSSASYLLSLGAISGESK
jgi:3-phosphoshikimate 1-carboxyvinyltransferase